MEGKCLVLAKNQQCIVHAVVVLFLTNFSFGEDCDTMVTRSNRLAYFGYSEPRVVPHEIVQINTKAPCAVSLCTGNDEHEPIRSIEFRCHITGLVRFENCDDKRKDFIGLRNCQVDLQSVTNVCDQPGLVQLHLQDSEILTNETKVYPRRDCLTLGVFSAVNTNLTQCIDTIFPPNRTSTVFRLQLVNASLTDLDIPNNFTQRFPHLNFLDLSKNSLRDIPVFPWNCSCDGTLSGHKRSKSLSKQCNSEFRLGLPENIQPNVLILDNNNSSTSSNVSISSCLHALSLVGNGISKISILNALSDLQNLRYLNLSSNSLRGIPTICSNHSATCELRVLDLSRNEIQTIPGNSFSTLRELRLLNLADNSFSSIYQNAFSKLNALEQLHLECNRLQFLDSGALPSDTASLKDVYLHHNPLNHIPASLVQLPGLRSIDLSHCDITMDTLQDTLSEIDTPTWLQSLLKEFTTRVEDIDAAIELASKRRRPYARFLNLSNNNITSIPAPVLFQANGDEASDLEIKFRLFFVNLKLNLSSNPLSCDSSIGEFLIYMQNHAAHIGDGTFQGNEYFYNEWKCSAPVEFRGCTLLSLNPRTLYLEDNKVKCPLGCSCHSFFRERGLMVQCENQSRIYFPQTIPERTLDLRLRNNKIQTIQSGDYDQLRLLESLDLSNNSLTEVLPIFLAAMPNLLQLALDHNTLQTLPREITRLTNVSTFWLSNNPYVCDCENLWLKSWLTYNTDRVADIDDIFCRKNDNTVAQLLLVSDSQFICLQKKSKLFYVVSMSVVTVMVCAIICSLIIYIYRLELRSLVYSWHQVRFLDSPKSPKHQEVIKTLVLAAEEDMAFCEHHVLTLLKPESPTDSAVLFRDYIAGMTHGDNISLLLKHSYRILVIVSGSLLQDEWRILALHKILLKARRNPDCLVLLTLDNRTHSERVNSLSELKKFYKTKRYYCLRSSDRLWKKKLKYLCSIPRTPSGFSVEQNWHEMSLLPSAERSRSRTHDIFIAHHDSDYSWAINELRVKLENSGYTTQLPDIDFTPGVDIQDNILHCVSNCRYILLVLSVAFLASEWAVFILRNAYERTLSENSNSLIVIKTEPLRVIEDQDLSVYLRTHAYVDLQDSDWWRKLERSLCPMNHTSPASDVHFTPDSASDLHLVPDSASDVHIAPDSASDVHLAPGVVSDLHLAPDSASDVHLAPDSVSDVHLTPDSVSDVHLAPDAASDVHLAPDSASDVHLAPGAASDVHLAPDSASDVYLVPVSASDVHLAPDSVSDVHLAPDSVSFHASLSGDDKAHN